MAEPSDPAQQISRQSRVFCKHHSEIVGPEDRQLQLMTKRLDVRETLGEKVMQELITK
jgi:hypothetical protein